MDSKVRGTSLQTLLTYDDIDPLCTWQREDAQDVLVIHLPEFKKEQLRIQISNTGLLKISGEKATEGKRKIRFLKEVNVTKDYDSNDIHAKFSQGYLRVTFPKKVVKRASMSEKPHVAATPSPKSGESDNINTNEKTVIPGIKTKVGQVFKSKTLTRVIINIGFVAVVAYSVYSAYNYWTSYVKTNKY